MKKKLGKNGNGKVPVVDGGGSLRCALMGDNLAKMAIDNGWEGHHQWLHPRFRRNQSNENWCKGIEYNSNQTKKVVKEK